MISIQIGWGDTGARCVPFTGPPGETQRLNTPEHAEWPSVNDQHLSLSGGLKRD